METQALPKPRIKRREINLMIEEQGIKAGLHPIAARVLASRPLPNFPLPQILSPRLAHLTSPFKMADCDRAASRLCDAILKGEIIGVETDHDCDGQTSHAVIIDTLCRRFLYPREKIRSYIGHRLKEGYGLSDSVVDRILSDELRPSLIITADNGSSDEPRIARLKEVGMDVIVTDHHEIPIEGYPKSAFACLNPTREDCEYQDPYIAGCMVAWTLMAATRQKLIEANYLPDNFPSLADCLDFVAVGTIADCVSMARSQNNRAVLRYGLGLIERETRPCWQAIKTLMPNSNQNDVKINVKDLAFKIGPLLNSDGRLSSALGSVSLLLAEDLNEANEILKNLMIQNEERKKIQGAIVIKALEAAEAKVKQARHSLAIYLEEGHVGVQGIVASRIAESMGRPVVIFSDKFQNRNELKIVERLKNFDNLQNSDQLQIAEGVQNREAKLVSGLITGSVRGIPNFHVRNALQWISKSYPGLILAFGGHKGAGGVTLELSRFEEFSDCFELASIQQLQGLSLGPEILSDGNIGVEDLNLELFEGLSQLEPFGREFEAPIFDIEAILLELRAVGDGRHAKVILEYEHQTFSGIWFGARKDPHSAFPMSVKDKIRVAFSLQENNFRGKRKIDLQIVFAEKI